MRRTTQDARRRTQLIVALDVDTKDEAERLVNILCSKVKIFKVGSQLFTTAGPDAVKMISKKGAQVFLDLKFHDIPHTVFQSVSAGTASAVTIASNTTESLNKGVKEAIKLSVFMMTVHTEGGSEMLKAAVRGATEKARELDIERPFIVGVTRLTSDNNEKATEVEVLEAARLARDSGLDGVVCSALEAPRIREEFGKDFLIVTPGIRPEGYPSDDQSRVATPQRAIEAGADYIVVGRPIIKAEDPLRAAKDIVNGILNIV